MRWINRTQSSFSKSFFSVFILGDSLFHHRPRWASNYHFSNPTRIVLVKGFMWGKLYSVTWTHRSQRSFSESFFLTFSSGYFLWPYCLQIDPKKQFSDSTEIMLAKSSTKYSCNSVSGSHISESSFSETFFSVFNWRYIFFHHSPLRASKYHFANSRRTLLSKGFLREKL